MIKYALRCGEGHAFDSWFQSAEAFGTLRAKSMIACPDCGSTAIEKALMAPKVRDSKKSALPVPKRDLSEVVSDTARDEALAEMRRQVEENSEYVGPDFATEARAIHSGEAPKRSIFGEANVTDAQSLIEDGIPVAPLPFPSRRKMN